MKDLITACKQDDVDAVERILNRGIDVNTKLGDCNHYSEFYPGWPLGVAVRYDSHKSVKLLLERGADLVLDNIGMIYDSLAGDDDLSEVTRGTIWKQTRRHPPWQYAVMPSKDVLLSILNAACCDGKLEVVQELLETEKDLGDLIEPLCKACSGGRLEVVKFLILRGADLNGWADCHLGTPLQRASWYGHAEVVKLLLSSGADPNVNEGSEGTALFAASTEGHIEVTKLLLSSGADINAMCNGDTPLKAASRGGHLEIVKLLLLSGADINAMG